MSAMGTNFLMVNDAGTFVPYKSTISEIVVYSFGAFFFDVDAGRFIGAHL